MATESDKDEVLRLAFASFRAFSMHSLSPAQTKIAKSRACECLHALGIEEFDGFKAQKPEGEILEHTIALERKS